MKKQPNKLGAQKLLRSTRGFTLTEILIASGIATVIFGTLIAGYSLAAENGKASAVTTAANSLKNAVTQFAQEHGNVVPITEASAAGQIPTAGATFSAATFTALSNGTTLETALLNEKCMERAMNLSVGPNLIATNPTAADVLWDVTLQAFRMNPDAAPTRDYSLCNRLECQVSNTTSPETAAGANFWLDGSSNIATGRRVVYLIIPNCPVSLAYKISRKIDGDNFSTNETTLDRKGAVVYNAPAPGTTMTTVYVYILDV